ncbi:MAG: FAD-dependent oxidoreductase [Thermodesulfobacteriota bacterium]
MDDQTHDVVVLGGGAGGVPAAVRASQLGGKVALVECAYLGGQCMNRGCIPFGHMMAAVQAHRELLLGRTLGLEVPEIHLHYPALLKRHEDLVGFMRQGIQSTLKKNRVESIEGRGKIIGKGAIEVNGKTLRAGRIILATGASWQQPVFQGAELPEVVNPDFLLTAEELPKRILLFGESPWLVEIAQFLGRFGSGVILATPRKRILPEESKTIVTRLSKVLRESGIQIRNGVTLEEARMEKDGLRVCLTGREPLEERGIDAVLTLERAAELKGIGLPNLHLDEDAPFLAVNEKTETAAEDVFAVGDMTASSRHHYSHRAAAMGIAAGENAMGKPSSVNHRTIPRVLFTRPEVASVGLTPREARERGYEIGVGAAPLSMNPLGMIRGEEEGMIEIVADRKYGEILGIHIIAATASEMIGQALMAIQLELTLHELAATPFPHPTLSESMAEAARDALGRAIYLP